MTYQTELQRLVEAKASMRQAIIDKGVEVPEEAKLVSYPGYIEQIGPPPAPTPGVYDLENLKLALNTSDPTQYFPIGQEIADEYAGNSNPLIVAQYLDSSNNSSYGGAVGVILVRKYVEPVALAFSSGSNDYSSSNMASFLANEYMENCSESVKNLISLIDVPYDGASVPAQWFLMSLAEIYSQDDGAYGTLAWDYWKQKTGFSSPSYIATAGRVLRSRDGTVRNVWLRNRVGASNVAFIYINGAIDSKAPTTDYGVLPACFIAKGGN